MIHSSTSRAASWPRGRRGDRRRCRLRRRRASWRGACANADDAYVRAQRFGGARHAGEQAAAADRHDQRVDLGALAQHFERDRSAAGDDGRIVVGMDHGGAVDDGERLCVQGRLGVRRTFEDDRRAELAGAADLDLRCGARHHDGRGDVEPSRVIGQALRVISGRRGDHAAGFLLVGQLQQRVERAALLERTGDLQLFELEADIDADGIGQPRRVAARRDRDRAAIRIAAERTSSTVTASSISRLGT